MNAWWPAESFCFTCGKSHSFPCFACWAGRNIGYASFSHHNQHVPSKLGAPCIAPPALCDRHLQHHSVQECSQPIPVPPPLMFKELLKVEEKKKHHRSSNICENACLHSAESRKHRIITLPDWSLESISYLLSLFSLCASVMNKTKKVLKVKTFSHPRHKFSDVDKCANKSAGPADC